jgi:hypothetical protein
MPDHSRIYRAADGNPVDAQVLARTRDLLVESTRLLKEPAPDTFLGRRRRENATPPDEKK